MTPKEKAIQLTNKYKNTLMLFDDDIDSKKCALIAVDEIISNTPYGFYSGIIPAYKGTDLDYWQEVKQEIEEL